MVDGVEHGVEGHLPIAVRVARAAEERPVRSPRSRNEPHSPTAVWAARSDFTHPRADLTVGCLTDAVACNALELDAVASRCCRHGSRAATTALVMT